MQPNEFKLNPIQDPTPDALAGAVRLLQASQLIGLPTETVYGLAGNAFDLLALARIFEAKERPLFDPLILHLPTAEAAFALALTVPPAARLLAEKFWPGPLTLILLKKPHVPDLATSGLPTVALRVPAHPIALQLLQQLDFPLAAPSANRFGRISPTTAHAVHAELGDRIPLILNGGPCRIGLESTVVDFSNETPCVRRLGGIPLEELEALLGPLPQAEIGDNLPPQAPGETRHHYAPRKPLHLVARHEDVPQDPHIGWLAFGPEADAVSFLGVKDNLSLRGDLAEAATNFFRILRALDDQPQIAQIYAVTFPAQGLGRAMNERLERAQTK